MYGNTFADCGSTTSYGTCDQSRVSDGRGSCYGTPLLLSRIVGRWAWALGNADNLASAQPAAHAHRQIDRRRAWAVGGTANWRLITSRLNHLEVRQTMYEYGWTMGGKRAMALEPHLVEGVWQANESSQKSKK